jgi:hypothetical protein
VCKTRPRTHTRASPGLGFFSTSTFTISKLAPPGQVWDRSDLGDTFIGVTVLDLEDRLFSPLWNAMGDGPEAKTLKPLEVRSLWHPSSRQPQVRAGGDGGVLGGYRGAPVGGDGRGLDGLQGSSARGKGDKSSMMGLS